MEQGTKKPEATNRPTRIRELSNPPSSIAWGVFPREETYIIGSKSRAKIYAPFPGGKQRVLLRRLCMGLHSSISHFQASFELDHVWKTCFLKCIRIKPPLLERTTTDLLRKGGQFEDTPWFESAASWGAIPGKSWR